MNKNELVESLINQVNELPHRDSEKLDALQRRSEMIIRTVFGPSSKYLDDLRRIHFTPVYVPIFSSAPEPEHYRDESWIDGTRMTLNLCNTMLEELNLSQVIPKSNEAQESKIELSNRIFIVHGHDEEMKLAADRTLGQLGLEPIILHEQPNQGRTIIEKFTDYSDVSFAVVLLSPDDIACPKGGSQKDAKLRARQNVIFELGFFVGKLGRNRVLILHRKDDNFEIPSDYSGVLFVPYDESGSWRFNLIRELKACSYDLDANKLL